MSATRRVVTSSSNTTVTVWSVLRFLRKRASTCAVVTSGVARKTFSVLRYEGVVGRMRRASSGGSSTCDSCTSDENPYYSEIAELDPAGPESCSVPKWFMNVDRTEAEKILTRGPPGTFLIRPSQTSPSLFSLSISTEKRPFHVLIRQLEDQSGFIIGRRRGKHKVFPSIESIVQLYEKEPIKLETRRKTTVVYTSLQNINQCV